MKTLNCGGELIDLSTPVVMGILNVTPDSFYDGGKYIADDQILQQAELMLKADATFIDVGGQSTRPTAELISEEEELKRVVPVIELLKKKFGKEIRISIDTFYSGVALEAVNAGAVLVNDISAGSIDQFMFEKISKLNVPYVLMHMQGTPKTMSQNPQHKNVTEDVMKFFIQKIYELKNLGMKDIIIDPGFGFGKTVQHNFSLLKHLNDFKILDYPMLAGISRKSMILKTLNIKAVDGLNGTTALNMLALQSGAKILRVHDVKECMQCINLWKEYDVAI